MTQYRFVRAVTSEDWIALPRSFAEGEAVQRFRGHTYGLDRDDALLLGSETIPCTLDGEYFFTVPVEMLHDEQGRNPAGDYLPVLNGG